ncbi:ABC transporter ATP-binding protein [Thermobifida halotolerans]|uniref:Spermidine/putrescine import ATP-binding protein PotA n=3 Tax=Thermobifida halotolerans TaxID=483545 RepID=A0AA97M6F7_9ACTN|nr:ABC transporter ATP-binding protein [Thermobifida halotolerans]
MKTAVSPTATVPGPPEPATAGARLQLTGIRKEYGDFAAVDDVSLDIEPGQFVTLLGASGSGKTTLLRIIAGFVDATAGRVVMDGADISGVPVHRRHIGMVFQNYALFPHMSVEKNVAFPLQMRRVPRSRRPAMVREALAAVRLEGLGHRMPRELSGGQQQRVALARAIVSRPRLLLMDEPLGALDRRLREALQVEIRRLSQDLGLTVVNVTHDQEEALTMSDRIALLSHGRLVQYGSPEDLYSRPTSDVSANFLGESNLFRASVRADRGQAVLDLPHGRVVVPVNGSVPAPGSERIVVVRPWAMRVRRADSSPNGSAAACHLPGTVTASIYAGDSRKLLVRDADGRELVLRHRAEGAPPCSVGDAVVLEWDAADSTVIVPTA